MYSIKVISILITLTLAISAYGAPDPKGTPQEEAGVESAHEPVQSLMGFQEWKSRQVLEAKQKLVAFKTPQETTSAEAQDGEEVPDQNISVEKSVEKNETSPDKPKTGASAEINEKAEKLRQLEFNLEIAQGLTIHDYFALYLKDKSRPQMESAIQKLTASELSELLMAYRTSLYGHPLEKKAEANLK